MDVLSDTLRVVRLAGALFFTAKFVGPWSVQSPTSADYARLLNVHNDCITIFHMMVSGRCRVSLEGQPAVEIAAGDIIVFPHAAPHRMFSIHNEHPAADATMQVLQQIQSAPLHSVPHIDYGSGNETTQFVCGYLQCDQRFNPLIGSLPNFMLVRNNQVAGLANAATSLPPWCTIHTEAGDWLDTTLRYTIEEASGERPGSSAMLPRLTELLFIEMLRRYIQQLPTEYTGWLAAVRDPIVGNALRLMHTNPEHAWTVEELAQTIAISRSALAQRFTALIGVPPIHYLQGWRMQVAQYLLGQTNLSISEIAGQTGYASEAAFNRTFKRSVGQPPATWRQHHT